MSAKTFYLITTKSNKFINYIYKLYNTNTFKQIIIKLLLNSTLPQRVMLHKNKTFNIYKKETFIYLIFVSLKANKIATLLLFFLFFFYFVVKQSR